MYYVTARFSAWLDGSVITVDGGWYHISSDYQWMTWRRWGYALDSHVIRLDTGEVRDLPASVSITPIWSPDSQWLLYITRENEREEIYRERPDGSVVQRVTPQPAHSYSMWSDPEEKWLYIDEAGQNLYRVRFDQLESELQLVAELSGWFAPYGWAPESVPGGPWLYFEGSSQCCDSGDIYRLNPETREVQPLTDDPAAYSNLFWSPEDMPGGPWLYFLSNRNNVQNSEYTIFRMRPDGSELERVTDQPADYDRLFWSPEDIAGGPWLYFLSNLDNTQGDTYAIFRMRPDGSELKRLTEFNLEPGGWHTTPKTVIQWSANHQWMEYGMVFPISCRMHPDGSARICFDDITTSPDGAWATVTAMTEDSETNNIYGLRQDGTSDLINLTQQSGKANYRLLAWAPEAVPDGPWLYFESDFSGNWELYRVSINNLQLENLTRDPGEDTFMDSANDIWSPEGVVGGPWLYFLSDRAGGLNLYRMQPDGSEVEMLTPTPEEHLYVRWSPDRRWLVFWASDIANVTDGFRMRPDGSELQQTIWLVKPDGAGDWHLREETPLDNDRWILEQDIDLSDCTN
jgi:Tol biopolymer transport system component